MCTNVLSKVVTKVLCVNEEPGAWTVLDVYDNIIVAGYSSPTSAPQLVSLSVELYDYDVQYEMFLAAHWSAPR